MHTMSTKDLRSYELDTFRRCITPIVVLIVSREVRTQEEAQLSVHDLNLIVTVKLHEGAPAVLSLGKLCEDHGYSY